MNGNKKETDFSARSETLGYIEQVHSFFSVTDYSTIFQT